MTIYKKSFLLYRMFCIFVIFVFIFISIAIPGQAKQNILNLPMPGTMLPPSRGFTPVFVKGLTVHPQNPLRFDFIIDAGDTAMDFESEEFKKESIKLIKYFRFFALMRV